MSLLWIGSKEESGTRNLHSDRGRITIIYNKFQDEAIDTTCSELLFCSERLLGVLKFIIFLKL